MKYSVMFILILMLTSCRSKQDPNIIPSLDRNTLYQFFFKANYNAEWCLWKPSAAEKDSCNVSFDGQCHTRLDTILNYTDVTASKAVLIFGTYGFDENGMADCHACAPIVSLAVVQKNDDNGWKVVKFIKNFGFHGSWGHLPDYSVTKLGKVYFLLEDWGYSNQGVTQSGKIFYHLPSLIESLQIESTDDSGFREDARTVTSLNDSLRDASEGSTTKVVVRTTGVSFEDGKGQTEIDSSRVYILNDSNIFRPQ